MTMSQQMHWATELIGKPYLRDAEGPDAFYCWSLIRHVFRTVHGIEMPFIEIGNEPSEENMRAIKSVAEVSGWRPSKDTQPKENDIVLMDTLVGPHVGMMVKANGAMLLLHCLEGVGVCVQPLNDLARVGFHNFSFWRHT